MDERALYETLLERPDDPSIALVFADWLEERADPMAEFFVLQSSDEKKAAQRAQDLLIMNWRRWFGPLAKVLRRRTSIFRNGFLRRAELLLEPDTSIAPLVDVPHWASVVELIALPGTKVTETFMAPGTRHPSIAAVFQSRWLKNLRALSCDATSLAEPSTPSFQLKRLRVIGDPSIVRPSPGWSALELLEVETGQPLSDELCAMATTIEQRLMIDDAIRLLQAKREVPASLTFLCDGWRFTRRGNVLHVHVTAMTASEVELVNRLRATPLSVTGLRTWQGPASQLRF